MAMHTDDSRHSHLGLRVDVLVAVEYKAGLRRRM